MQAKNQSTSRIVTGIFSETRCAGNAMAALVNAGFDRRNLSVLGSDLDEFKNITAQLKKPGPDLSLLYCTAIGASIGAICGWCAAMLLPEMKYFMPLVPIFAAVTGAAAGAFVGLVLTGFTQLDMPSIEPEIRSRVIRKGILVSVFVKDSTSRYRAEYLLEKCGAEEIFVAQPQEEISASTA